MTGPAQTSCSRPALFLRGERVSSASGVRVGSDPQPVPHQTAMAQLHRAGDAQMVRLEEQLDQYRVDVPANRDGWWPTEEEMAEIAARSREAFREDLRTILRPALSKALSMLTPETSNG